MSYKIIENPDEEYAKEIKAQIKRNNKHCPSREEKTRDTKCMCKEFRDMVERGETGACRCGLYFVVKTEQ